MAASARWCSPCRSSTAWRACWQAQTWWPRYRTTPRRLWQPAVAYAPNHCRSRPARISSCPWPGAAPRTTTPPSAGCARASRCSWATRTVSERAETTARYTDRLLVHPLQLPCFVLRIQVADAADQLVARQADAGEAFGDQALD